MPSPFKAAIVTPVMIGRSSHLELLARFVEDARNGQGRTVLIAGEAGVGKSRLVAEVKTRLKAAPANGDLQTPIILQGSCFEPDRSLPYAPLLDLLYGFVLAQPSDQVGLVVGPAARAIVTLLPDLARLFPDLAPAPFEPEIDKHWLFRELEQLFARIATRRPLLIVVEDLHWSDDASLEFLLFLARRVVSQPILLIVTYRSDEIQPDLDDFLARVNRERLAAELAVTPLTTTEVGAMIGATFPRSGSVDPGFLSSLYALTEGNPFFIEEILKSLSIAGDTSGTVGVSGHGRVSGLRIPRSIQVAVQRRLSDLSLAGQQVLSCASVAGRRFDFVVLQLVTQYDEAELSHAIKGLIEAQLVVEEESDVFTFRHALTRAAVYADLLTRERKSMHRIVAESIERAYAEALDPRAADLAHHYSEAEIWLKALDYAGRAAERAQRMNAPRAAVEQWTRFLDAAGHLELAPSPEPYRARGKAYELLGSFEAARADHESALAVARASSDRPAEWLCLLDLGFLWTERDYLKAGAYFQLAFALARELGDRSALAHSLNRVGNWYVNAEQPLEGLRYHQEALAIFQAENARRGCAETWDLLGTARYFSGDLIAGAACFGQAIKLYRELDHPLGVVTNLVMRSTRCPNYLHDALVWPFVEPSEATAEAEQALALARKAGWRSGEAFAQIYLGLFLGPRGEYEQARAYLETAARIATDIEHRQWLTAANVGLGALALDLLDPDTALGYAEEAVRLGTEIGSSFSRRLATALLASVRVARRELDRAEAALGPSLDGAPPLETLAQRFAGCARIDLELAKGDLDAALALADRVIAAGQTVGTSPIAVIPRLWHARGEALARLGRLEEAATAFRDARQAARQHGARPRLWRICLSLGKLHYRQPKSDSRRVEADAAIAEARATIEALAASIADNAARARFLRRATALFPHPTGRPPGPAAPDRAGGLTERERDVAARIASGATNRRLADELVVSERTIDKHVENILNKLGFNARAQIAAWAVEQGLTRPSD